MTQHITTRRELSESIRDGKYAWPGGYPKFWLTADGETLSYEGVRDRFKQELQAISDGERGIVACDVNWEDGDMRCAHTNERIESAYGEDESESL